MKAVETGVSNIFNSGGFFCFDAGTHILLDRGSGGKRTPFASLITQKGREAFPAVAGQDHPRQLVAISNTARNDRPLYHINGADFYFTAGHPFVNYDAFDGAAGAPYWLCVDPSALEHRLPVFRDLGIGQLQPGSRLVATTGNGQPQLVEVQSLAPISPQPTQTILHDLVLSPDPSDRYLYYVGDGQGPFFMTSAQIPSFTHYPYATIALLKALTIARPAIAEQAMAIRQDRQDFIESQDQEQAMQIALHSAQLVFDELILHTLNQSDFWQPDQAQHLLDQINTKTRTTVPPDTPDLLVHLKSRTNTN